MHRLTVFFHDIVGNIDDIVDRTDALSRQTTLHPFRRWSDLDILNHTGCVARTQLCIFDFNADKIFDILIVACWFYNRRTKWFVECNSSFSCNTEDTEAVYTVGCDLVFNNSVI